MSIYKHIKNSKITNEYKDLYERPVYIEKEICKVIVNEDKDCRYEERYYVEVDYTPLSLQNDKAMVLVTNHAHREINQIGHEVSSWINDLTFAKPTKENPTYYREGKRLYIQGLSSSIRPTQRSLYIMYAH